MMKLVRTSELSGLALDWAVTLIEEPAALKYGAARPTGEINAELAPSGGSTSTAGPLRGRRAARSSSGRGSA